MSFAGDMPPEQFDWLLLHMSHCADAHRKHVAREKRRAQLDRLFEECDHTGVSTCARVRDSLDARKLEACSISCIRSNFPLKDLIRPCVCVFQVGLLDRHRVLNLFDMFYDQAAEEVRDCFRNPRHCT